jgi:hypothetical protein
VFAGGLARRVDSSAKPAAVKVASPEATAKEETAARVTSKESGGTKREKRQRSGESQPSEFFIFATSFFGAMAR